MSVKALTYNVWNIPVAQHTRKRIDGIAKAFEENKDGIDIIGLQECWKEEDRDQLVAAAKRGGLVYSIFFRSGCGFPGGNSSGLVVMSRWPITNSFFHRFSAAGKPQKVLHWDYSMFSGKGVGLAQIQGPPEVGTIDFYVSHFVAYYTPQPGHPEHDEYVHHRCLGAWETARFIQNTARSESLVVCGVDLNASDTTLTYRALTGLGGLSDAWKEGGRARKGVLPDALAHIEEKGLTVNYAGNCYFENNAWIASGEPSERVDFVLYREPEHISIDWCERRFAGVEDSGTIVSLSDHAGVLACFKAAESKQPKSLETSEMPSKPPKRLPGDSPSQTCALLDELAASAACGIKDTEPRRKSATIKARGFAVIAFIAWAIPHCTDVSSTWLLAALVIVSVVFAAATFAYAVVANIAIPDEYSAMVFMLDSVNFQRQWHKSQTQSPLSI